MFGDHSIHIILLFSLLSAALLVWFWSFIALFFHRKHYLTANVSLKFRLLVLLILLVISVLHFSPLTMLMAYHHQAQDHSTQHPCCMPQNAITTSIVVLNPPSFPIQAITIKSLILFISLLAFQINNKSPPLLKLV